MDLFDVKPKKEWKQLLDEIHSDLGMPACIVDEKNKIVIISGERNLLCEGIREKKEALNFICSQTQQFMASETSKSKKQIKVVIDKGATTQNMMMYCPTEDTWAPASTKAVRVTSDAIPSVCESIPGKNRDT